jgi:PAS domain S-box-containing protein
MKRPGIHPDPVPEANLRALQEKVNRMESSQSEYKQLEVSLEKKTRQQSLLLETAQSLTASLDPTEVLRRIAAGAVKVVEASSCDLYLLEPDGQTLTPVISIDPEYPEEILATSLKVDHSLTGQCITEKRCLVFNDPANHPASFQVPGTPVEPDERIITAPLIADDRVWGALCINRSGADFTQEDLELSQAYAALAASVLKNARTHTELAREVEERMKVERALTESEEHFRSLVQQSLEGIILLDENGKYLEWNDAMQVITGFPRKDVLGQFYWDVQFKSLPPESRTPEMYERVKRLTQEALKNGKASFFERSMEVTFQRADGALRTVQQMAFPIRTGQGFRIGGTYNDITERKFAQEALQYRTSRCCCA